MERSSNKVQWLAIISIIIAILTWISPFNPIGDSPLKGIYFKFPFFKGFPGTIQTYNTSIEGNGWSYNFRDVCFQSCAWVVNNTAGKYHPSGRLVAVVVFLVNNTGFTQQPPKFYLQDSQRRIYNSLPNLSHDFFEPSSVDLFEEENVPVNEIPLSIALYFDIEPDATNLILFSDVNPDTGWLVLSHVQ